VCGSRVTVDVNLDDQGRVAAIGMVVRACALGQASAALMEAHAAGRSVEELEAARDGLADWLSGARAAPPDWPGLDLFTPALAHRGRHPA
ncbi:iron-sulfur cluster assembly scaffold protein, partial [Escherichia coli]|nr:iron-sulfur cluster assembly scaffold protein [Escherichia coli]